MSHRIQPLGNRVLVRRREAKATKGGILLPDSAQEKSKVGDVIAVGPGKRDEDGNLLPMHVEVGNQVLFSAYAGTEVKDEKEEEFLIVTEDDILGVLHG